MQKWQFDFIYHPIAVKEFEMSHKNELKEFPEELVDNELLTIPEAAETSRLSIAWWRQAIFQRKVRFVKLSRRVFIPKSTIRQLIKDGTVEPRRAVGEDA
jgi:hypothetical protein